MRDGHGRTIDYLRISLTDRCNLRCIYCMPEDGVEQATHDEILRIEEIARVVQIAAGCGIKRVRLTGGEPLVRRGVLDLVRDVAGTPGIEEVSLTTNGVLLPDMAARLAEAGLSRVNISLDTLDPAQFSYITRRGHLDDVMAGIDAALDAGLDPVKLNCLAVRSLGQDFTAFARLSVERPLHVRFIEYMPVGHSVGVDGAGWTQDDSIPAEELRATIDAGLAACGLPTLEPLDDGEAPGGAGPARYWKIPGAAGTVGFISGMSDHFCSECNRLRLTADGKLRPCLFSDDELDLRAALRDGKGEAAVRRVLEEAIGAKPEEHGGETETQRDMSRIGG